MATSYIQSASGYLRLYITTSVENISELKANLSVKVYLWTKYSCSDSNNTLYCDAYGTSANNGAVTAITGTNSSNTITYRRNPTINTTVDSGDGFNTANRVLLYSHVFENLNRGTANSTKYIYAKLDNIYDPGAGKEVPISHNVTAIVQKKPSYTVTYNANGGSGAPGAQTKYHGTDITLSSTKPTRTGYTFSKWNTKADGNGTSYNSGVIYSADASVTLYARWTAKTYTVTYDLNGGSGSFANQTKMHGVDLPLHDKVPTKTNHTFRGWSTSLTSTSVSYAKGATYTGNANLNLYAVWQLSYVKPKITNVKIRRCDSNGNLNSEGLCGLVTFNFECQQSLASNNSKITWGNGQFKLLESSDVMFTTNYRIGSVSKVIGVNEFDINTEYRIGITVADTGGETTVYGTLEGNMPTIDLFTGGKGIAFGKNATTSDLMDVNFNARFRKNVTTSNLYGPVNSSTGAYNRIDVNDAISLDGDGDIIIPNTRGYYAKNTDGATRALISCNSKNVILVGYGGYSSSDCNTAIYGNAKITFTTRTNGEIDITNLGANKILWGDDDSGYYMTSDQTITLSGNVSAQVNGIMLVWSTYDAETKKPNNTDFNYTFIPKYHASKHSGKGVCCFMTSGGLGAATLKYVYVTDTTIKGNAVNNADSSTTATGIKKTPTNFVLRRVIGV